MACARASDEKEGGGWAAKSRSVSTTAISSFPLRKGTFLRYNTFGSAVRLGLATGGCAAKVAGVSAARDGSGEGVRGGKGFCGGREGSSPQLNSSTEISRFSPVSTAPPGSSFRLWKMKAMQTINR